MQNEVMIASTTMVGTDFITGTTFEESQPDLRVRLRLEVKDSNQGSQSTRGVIGLEISGLFARPPSAAIAYPNAEIINATTERERKA